LSEKEQNHWLDEVSFNDSKNWGNERQLLTLLWSCKEAVYKWHGAGSVDFKEHISLKNFTNDKAGVKILFTKSEQYLEANFRQFEGLTLVWII
jgi:phosphopantetheinyl transferase